jgi:serine/threonine-protein kinase
MARQHPHVQVRVPETGDIVAGKYQIERVLGAGGMGVVFAAVHLHLQERVALKLLSPELGLQDEVITAPTFSGASVSASISVSVK